MKSPYEVLKTLPADTPLYAAHVLAIYEAMKAGIAQEQNYSQWDPEKNIDPETLGEWLGETPKTIEKWRENPGDGPAFTKKKKNVSYQVQHVREWIKSRTVSSTSEATTKGLSRFEDFPDTFPVFTYPNGLKLGLEASIAFDDEVEPSTFMIVRMSSQGDFFELEDSLLADLEKAEKLLLDSGLNDFSMPYWFYSQALTGPEQNSQLYIQAVRMLVKNGMDINAPDPKSGMTLAHVLVWTEENFLQFSEMLITFLEMGLDVDKPDSQGMSAMTLAELDDSMDDKQSLFVQAIHKRNFKSSLETMLKKDNDV